MLAIRRLFNLIGIFALQLWDKLLEHLRCGESVAVLLMHFSVYFYQVNFFFAFIVLFTFLHEKSPVLYTLLLSQDIAVSNTFYKVFSVTIMK